jgi:hypothetical protein
LVLCESQGRPSDREGRVTFVEEHETERRNLTSKPEYNKVLTVPEPGKVEFVNRPYPRVKPGSILVKTEIAAVCVDDRMYTDHTHEWFDHPLYGVVATHEFPMTQAEQALKISATQRCGKILLYPHGLPDAQGGG